MLLKAVLFFALFIQERRRRKGRKIVARGEILISLDSGTEAAVAVRDGAARRRLPALRSCPAALSNDDIDPRRATRGDARVSLCLRHSFFALLRRHTRYICA
jgi:hypothetical protein